MLLGLAGLLVTATDVHAQSAAGAARPDDGPQWAAPGPWPVGVRSVSIDAGAVDALDALARGDSAAAPVSRALAARLWYPSVAGPGAGTLSRSLKDHPWRGWNTPSVTATSPSRARLDAAPAPGSTRWPVVVLSHGLMNWAELMADLGEHLASHGHVVVAVQHEDEGHEDPLRAALAFRPLDIEAARDAVQRIDATPGDALSGRLDLQRMAVVGYSMGGYGALVTAGARVQTDSLAFRYVPGRSMAPHATGSGAPVSPAWKAVVAIAPWGGQRQFGALAGEGLRGIKIPALLLGGDQDDISGYTDGVRSVWTGLTATTRWLLTLENARHNIGHMGWVNGLPSQFRTWEAFEEPVWRRDRLLQVQRHFILAFLGRHLGSVEGTATALEVPTARAADGTWPVPWGTAATGDWARPGGPGTGYWPGFQRRWALGLRLEKLPPGPVAAPPAKSP
ncbi:MAG: alpha/beta hydrolase family protein [Rubrivivax sp.]